MVAAAGENREAVTVRGSRTIRDGRHVWYGIFFSEGHIGRCVAQAQLPPAGDGGANARAEHALTEAAQLPLLMGRALVSTRSSMCADPSPLSPPFQAPSNTSPPPLLPAPFFLLHEAKLGSSLTFLSSAQPVTTSSLLSQQKHQSATSR